jgi:hypothetical protein
VAARAKEFPNPGLLEERYKVCGKLGPVLKFHAKSPSSILVVPTANSLNAYLETELLRKAR